MAGTATAESVTAAHARPRTPCQRLLGSGQARQVAGRRRRAHADARSAPTPPPPILASAREAQSSLTSTSADAREPDQVDLRRHRACRWRTRHRQHDRQRSRRSATERAERAGRRLQRGRRHGQVDLRRRRALGARRLHRLRLDHDRQDRRDRHLRAAADRPPVADDRRQARLAGRGASAPRPASSRTRSTASPQMR